MVFTLEQMVSKQILEKYKIYEQLLRDWNHRTLLVQEDTLNQFINRHLIDSLQIIPILNHYYSTLECQSDLCHEFYTSADDLFEPIQLKYPIPNFSIHSNFFPKTIIDVGTGAGFPGMVLAMAGLKNVTLCESNYKKCLFLEEVARQTSTNVTIIHDRIENVRNRFDIILSRALTQLDQLCKIMFILKKDRKTIGLFHKGQSWQQEYIASCSNWSFEKQIYKSLLSDLSIILLISNIMRKGHQLSLPE